MTAQRADGPPPIHSSRTAKAIYWTSYRTARPLVRAIVTPRENSSLDQRLRTAGRWIERASRLQRFRLFRHINFARTNVDGITVETVYTKHTATDLKKGVILYFHGGGFVCGNLDSHLHHVINLSRQTGLPVAHVDYRQFPKTTVAGSVTDCLEAYHWLLNQSVPSSKIILAGDSAGGFIAFAIPVAAQGAGLPQPAGVIGLSPLLELDPDARNVHRNAARDHFGATYAMPAVIACAQPGGDTGKISPVDADLRVFPPSLIVAAESEILFCDAERMQQALKANGKSCTLLAWPDQLHTFPVLFPFLRESKQAFRCITEFVHAALSSDGATNISGDEERAG